MKHELMMNVKNSQVVWLACNAAQKTMIQYTYCFEKSFNSS